MLSNLPETAECATHGAYLVRSIANGAVFAHNPGGCPKCLADARADRLLASSNIPARFADCHFHTYVADTEQQRRVLKACERYAFDFPAHLAAGRGLILVGKPGTGKNHLATAICKVVQGKHFTVLRVKAAEFLDAYWGSEFKEREAWLRELASVHLLILDEVGRTSSTANAQNAFFRLIDARYEAVRPTMILSNLDRSGLISELGDAAYDRLTEAGTQRLTFDWESSRSKVGVAIA